MGDQSPIEWTDATWNPTTGCTKVSQGCKNCYAERIFNRPYPGRAFTDVRTHPDRLHQPLSWQKRRRIFVNSMSDLFHEDVPDEFIESVFFIMAACHKRHTFQILTKRPQRMLDWFEWFIRRKPAYNPNEPYSHVWLGVSVENQATADERIPLLLQTPAAVRFVSAEPLLGPVGFEQIVDGCVIDMLGGQWVPDFEPPVRWARVGLDWLIAGGESGPRARPAHPDWVRSLRNQCQAAGVPFFFKQWGEWIDYRQVGAYGWRNTTPTRASYDGPCRGVVFGPDGDLLGGRSVQTHFTSPDSRLLIRVGKKAAGRLLDGRTWDEYPANA